MGLQNWGQQPVEVERPLRGAPRKEMVPVGASAASPVERPQTPALNLLPPLPEGVTDLQFGEIYRTPVGPAGLEFTDKARQLAGQRVRMMGYMIRQSQPVPWCFLFSHAPLRLHEREYGFAEDLPASAIHVFVQKSALPIVPYTPGRLLLTGTLQLGPQQEPDGRVSHVRMLLDPPTAEQRQAIAKLASATLQPAKISTNTATESKSTP